MFILVSENKKLTTSNFVLIQRQSFLHRCKLKEFKIIYPDGYVAQYTPPVTDQEQ